MLHGGLPCLGAEALDSSFLRDYAETRGFRLGRPVNPQPTSDGKSVVFLRALPRVAKMSLLEFDIATGQTRVLFSPEQILKGAEEKLSPEEKARRERMRVSVGGITRFELSDDGSQILAGLSGKLYVASRTTGHIQELETGAGTVLDPKFSPDARFVAYVRDYDVCAYDLAKKKERRVTFGGSEKLTHGLAEFVAQEEMSRFSGFWWSPDSRHIAYEEADASEVEVWHVADPARPEQPAHPSYYPRPGKANVKARLGVISARGGKTTWVRWDAERYPYLAKVDWSKGNPLTFVVQSRDQKELALLQADPKTGVPTELLTERDPAWLNLDQQVPRWLEDGSGFLWTSERNGGTQLELREPGGKLRRVLVAPDAGYQGLADVNETARIVTYRASQDTTQSHLYRVSFDGGNPERLTLELGLHNAVFAKNHSIYVHQVSTPESMPQATIHRADGSRIGELPSVAENPSFVPRAEVTKVGEGGHFYAEIIRPQNFDANKRYPVIVDVYGGPHANVVQASMGTRLLGQWLADQGFVVVSVDGRGTPGRGREWERAIFKKFGSVPLEDQVAGLQALAARYPEIDSQRVGIVGWSFGGYMAALAVLKRPDVFKAAVAGAPVTDWEDYDTHYTERYMGFPETDAEAYRDGSLLTYASKLQRPLLIVHGTADDNVYFRHSLKLANALFRAGKEFELLPLPGLTHMVPDPVVTERLWTRIASHFRKHLVLTTD
ncbi:MAG: DPP IV N-terminal domain-containing protein [Verrucomicrobia bacterium]|nr:DPP IV N-terminal domain-containing protein [Verrucomicrobiota bacterium]